VRDEIRTLARHRFDRAREALADGERLLAAGGLRGATNRFYYAALFAARALLATREVDSARHAGVIALFQRHFAGAGLVDMDRARALARAFEKRQKVDYADFSTITPEEVHGIRDEVDAFVRACASTFERLATTEGGSGEAALQ